MDDVEDELWVALREAMAMEHARARTALLEEAVARAEADDVRRVTFVSRRLLAHAYRLDGRWDEVFRLFRACLDEHDHRPWRFDEDDVESLLTWYAWLVECMADFPDISLVEIRAALDDVERRFRAAGLGVHQVCLARRGVAVHLGDWAAADRYYRQWTTTGDFEPDDRWLRLAAVEQLLARGDGGSVARARTLARPMLLDASTVDRPTVLARSLLLLPVARSGDLEQAAVQYRRLLRGMDGEFHSLEVHGRIVEFCALTGNEDAGIDWLGPMKGFEERRRPMATMEFATSVAVLAGRLVRAGRGDTALDLGDDPNSTTFRVLADRMRRLALDLADRFDRRNGTSARGDRIRARLAAEPVVDHLPLSPTNRRPLPTLPPAGLSDAELLDRAVWHDLRCEPDQARACLTVLSGDLPGPLAAREAELRAKFFQSEETEAALWRAARAHREFGDERRVFLNHCRLGLWIVHSGRVREGISLIAEAVAGLRGLGDDSDCAWGEHWLAYASVGEGRYPEAESALRRGLRHARHDPLARGSLLLLEATAFPERTASAAGALEAFVVADAPEKALEALALLENAGAHHDLVEPLLGRVADRADRLVGRLRYLRACALIDAGRPADAVDDLNEAIGQASLREGATVEQWYQLVHASHAAGRFEDAVDAGLRAASQLDHLRDNEDPSWAEWADQSRYLVAESYRQLGDTEAALREYRRLADGNGPLAATAFVAGSALLDDEPA